MRSVLFAFCILVSSIVSAQSDSTISIESDNDLQVSILTCGVGDDLYASFGHIGIRVKNSELGIDEVYNYGTFDYSDPDFYVKFTLGKLLYYLSKSSFNDFMADYEFEGRSVHEQVLQLSDEKEVAIVAFLQNNIMPENRAYHYDFMLDNCATRIRDIFPLILGPEFYWGDVLNGKQISYRTVLNQYLGNKHWERFGINLLLGNPVDVNMTDENSMFLPDFLREGLKTAYYKDHLIVGQENVLLENKIVESRTLNGPMWMMVGILILTILVFHVPAFNYLKPVIRFVLLLLTGLLGFFILFMWLVTNHQACNDNYNILWAFPPNLIIAFLAHKKVVFLKLYGLAAISFLMVALIIHVIGLQKLPLIELSPLLLSLMYIYIDMYKTNIQEERSKSEKAKIVTS